jgi:hypothetical protein
MHATTSFKVDADNISLVEDLTKTRELSKILNYLLRQYKADRGYISSEKRIVELETRIKAKEQQYEALKQEISGQD